MPLKVSDGIAAYIDDFQKSDAPQFKGKSKKERRDMAIAAYLTAKRGGKPQEDVKEAAPKPLNRSNHTHTVDISGEGRYKVKAKSMDHAKKLAFKKAGISKLHGHPTMEPKTRIMGESVNEETNFAVSIEGLPMMFMSADSPGMLKQTLRKIVKQPSMIKAVKRVTDAKVKKTFRLKAQGREEDEE